MAFIRCNGAGADLIKPNTWLEFANASPVISWDINNYTDGTAFTTSSCTLSSSYIIGVKGKSTLTLSVTTNVTSIAGIKNDGTIEDITISTSMNIAAYDVILIGRAASSNIPTVNITVS